MRTGEFAAGSDKNPCSEIAACSHRRSCINSSTASIAALAERCRRTVIRVFATVAAIKPSSSTSEETSIVCRTAGV